jgi:galactose oxidase
MKPNQLILAACLAAVPLAARAEVRSVTLGISMNCPYGLGGWWVAVREGLQRLEGVEEIAETPDVRSWTCSLRTREGRLPDPALVSRHLEGERIGATLRGVEITADGLLERNGGELELRLSGTGEIVRLAPARKSVYWNVGRKRARRLSDQERSACSRLRSQWRERAVPVRVVGPLIGDGEKRTPVLEVRSFSWLSKSVSR